MSTSPYTPGSIHHRSRGGAAQAPEFAAVPTSCCQEFDAMKRDRFELLSAYLDGEVTPDERQMVLGWLRDDPDVRCLYNRLITLRQGLRDDTQIDNCDVDVTLSGVFRSLNHRFQLISMASVGVVVIGALNLLSGSFSSSGFGSSNLLWRWVLAPESESLSIALDQPAFPIPDASAAIPADGVSIQDKGGLPVDSDL